MQTQYYASQFTYQNLAVIYIVARYSEKVLMYRPQILPSLIPSLRLEGSEEAATAVEFGTVFVYTCLKSCWGDSQETTNNADTAHYKNEPIYLQAEML